jgi:DNA-binding transcriptional LysR family regulator
VQALGVALAGATSAARQLAVGRLLAVFGEAVTREAHFLVCPPSHSRRRTVQAFLAWIHAEAAASR